MTVPNKLYDVEIKSLPKLTNAVYFETDDFLLLFFSIQNFVIFQQVLKPYIFAKSKNELNIKDKNVNVIRDFETVETEQGKTIIFSNKHGIKKLVIPLQIEE